MSWVDHPTYFGPDRRQARSGFRLFERRRRHYVTDTPTLAAAMRRLRLQVIDVTDAHAAAHFAEQCQGVVELAKMRGRGDIAALLQELCTNLADENAEADYRIAIDYTLAACAERLVYRAPRCAEGGFAR